MRFNYQKFLSYAIPLFLAAVAGVILAVQIRQVALSHSDNQGTFYSFANGFTNYKQIRQEWRPRIASTFLAGQYMNLFPETSGNNTDPLLIQVALGTWTGFWFFFCCLIMVLLFKEKSLLFIFGTFVGVLFAYTNGMGIMRLYPWDMLALFVFCCFIALIRTKHEAWLPVFIPLAMVFKETALVLVVALLFWPGASWKKRIFFTAITLIAGLGLKSIVDLITENPAPLFSMTYRDYHTMDLMARQITPQSDSLFAISLFKSNLQRIFSLRLDSPFFIDAGLLTVLYILPIKKRAIAMLKSIAGLFLIGNMLFSVIIEYRIWFEVIPLALYGLHIYFYETESAPAALIAEKN